VLEQLIDELMLQFIDELMQAVSRTKLVLPP
jgi:hypothetical protein